MCLLGHACARQATQTPQSKGMIQVGSENLKAESILLHLQHLINSTYGGGGRLAEIYFEFPERTPTPKFQALGGLYGDMHRSSVCQGASQHAVMETRPLRRPLHKKPTSRFKRKPRVRRSPRSAQPGAVPERLAGAGYRSGVLVRDGMRKSICKQVNMKQHGRNEL